MKTRVDTLRKAVESFQHEYHCIFPQLPNLIHLRTFEDLIRAPSNVPVTLEDFLALRPILPDIVERWKDDCTRHLSETIRVKAGIPDDVDPLQLPVGTYFICECDEFSTSRRAEWPHTMNAILSHEPNFAFLFCIKYDTDPDQMSTSELCAALIHESPWSYRWAEKYNWFIEVVQDLVRMCGGDPLRTTAAELDTFSVRFTCKACLDLNPTHPEVRRVMTWRAAVSQVLYKTSVSSRLMSSYPFVQVGHIALCRACLERTYKEAEEKHGQVHMLEVWKPRSKATEEIVLATEEKCRLQAERILNKKTIWYCSHCTPVSKGEKRDQVLQHLRDM
ncbi:hypothetical protein K474DRAFT_420454 [Panus rudis PR-1116 ss-1]|nr:hypothetical protein K474DRAFT_420454 [Panus rudis PR-1116 ss-1]